MTGIELVHEVAAEHGKTVSDEEADYILWNHTGFPSFWGQSDPQTRCRQQLAEFFSQEES